MKNAIALSLVLAALATGQQPKMPDSERQAILDYQLTMPRANQLITALEAMTKYVVTLPDYAERVRRAMTQTPAQRVAAIEADPKVAAIVKQNGLTAKDYIVGVVALRYALLVAQGVRSDKIFASQANLAFAKANMAELKPKMDAADGIQRGR